MKNLKIQFFLGSDGASHKFLGIDPYYALKDEGYDVKCFFPKRNMEAMHYNPDYIFCLKFPEKYDNTLKEHIKYGTKLIYIATDERISKERMKMFDGVITCSYGWFLEFNNKYPYLPCYLINEEYNYCMHKQHTNSTRLVTMGYKECLQHYLRPIIDIIKPHIDDITIISNWDNQVKYDKLFSDVNRVKYRVGLDKMCDRDFDKIILEQYNEYDIGLIMQNPNGLLRPPTRLKGLLYAGLPCVAINSYSHDNIWFNDVRLEKFLVSNHNDWVSSIEILKNKEARQAITDFNYKRIKDYYGYKRLVNDYTNAIKYFEGTL